MSIPSEIEPDTIIDLVDDCREVSSVLAPYVIDLTKIPTPRGALPFEVSARAIAALDGYGEYGS